MKSELFPVVRRMFRKREDRTVSGGGAAVVLGVRERREALLKVSPAKSHSVSEREAEVLLMSGAPYEKEEEDGVNARCVQ